MNYGQRQITLRKISRCMTSSQKFRHSKFSVKKKLQIDTKWSEKRKKHEAADPSAATPCRPILRVEYDNTSYQTTFHQDLSINVAYPQNSFGCLKVSDGSSPPLWSPPTIYSKYTMCNNLIVKLDYFIYLFFFFKFFDPTSLLLLPPILIVRSSRLI